jgi:cytochrome c5
MNGRICNYHDDLLYNLQERLRSTILKRDQKFYDLYSLVIGVLALVIVAIFVLSAKMTNLTADIYTAGTEEYRATIADRLRPFGQVYLPGEEHEADQPVVQEAARVEPVATALSGPQVFNEACIVCHGSGIAGAPILSDQQNWAPRIAQGNDLLYQHAIEGYTGQAGYMPPKGARLDLSDAEIEEAVDYMISEAQ